MYRPVFQINCENLADWANVIIAICSIILAGYVFIYQRRKDNTNTLETQQQIEQNIKLRWFKELIIQPNLGDLENFFETLHTLCPRFRTSNDEEKMKVDEELKKEFSKIRRKLIDILLSVDSNLHTKVLSNHDDLLDHIVNTIYDSNYNLLDDQIYNEQIENKILTSKNRLIGLIYNYKGIPERVV